ncbi:MAG: AAA family ATPase, partial [Phycisphaerae bacterium]|nr:AAA family ATPase [Phycisphaerae bacterium]MDW8261840.1 AAA family ATPase [Phycisphaerales bacterium]
MPRERIISAESQGEPEERLNLSIRPRRFDEYVGQPQVIAKLRIAVAAAVKRQEPVEHVLLHGPPGLGKTSLAHVIAHEVGAQVHVVAGPAITRGADLTGILNRLARGDVLFIDEIHRLPVVVEESLYSAMEDFKIDLTMEAGMHARTITVPVKPFTLIGATTRIGLLTSPMRARFGIVAHVEFYPPQDLLRILQAN